MLLRFTTSELIAHGTMLFATLTAVIQFLRVVQNHKTGRNKKTFYIFAFVGLFFLIFITSYMFIRLYSYGKLTQLTIDNSVQILSNKTGENYPDFSSYYIGIVKLSKQDLLSPILTGTLVCRVLPLIPFSFFLALFIIHALDIEYPYKKEKVVDEKKMKKR